MSLPLSNETAVAPVPLQYRSVPASLVLLNSLVGRRWHWPGLEPGQARLITIDRVLGGKEVPEELSASFSWLGMEFAVVGAQRLFSALCGFDPWLAGDAVPDQPVEAGWALRDVMAVVNNFWFSTSPQWVAPRFECAAWQGEGDALECSVWSPDGVWLDRFWLVPGPGCEDLRRLRDMIKRSALGLRPTPRLPAVPMRIPVVVGELSVLGSRLQQAEVGGAVLFEHTRLTANNELTVLFPGGVLRCQVLSPGRVQVIAPVEFSKSIQGQSMDSELNMGDLSLEPAQAVESVDHGAAAVLMDVPVRVQAVAGAITLTVAEIARIKVGDCLELEGASAPVVRVLVNGKDIGAGELVDINGRLGLQISRWDVAS